MSQQKPESVLVSWRNLILLIASSVCIVVYLYINRSDARHLTDLATQFALPGDFGAYALRFGTSSLLFGIIPLGLALLLGLRPRSLGLRMDAHFVKSPVFWLTLVALVGTAAISTPGSEIEAFYPFSRSLVSLVPTHPWLLAMHAGLYLFAYYLPWEILFRGILLFPFLADPFPEQNPSWKAVLGNPRVLALACWQLMPTVLIHYPHPLSETLGAIPFAVIAALLTLRFRSIIPALVIHFLCGFAVDAIIIVRAAGFI